MPIRLHPMSCLLLILSLILAGCLRAAPGQVLELTLTDRVDASGRPLRALSTFSTAADTIYAVAVVGGAAPGTRISVRWYVGGVLVQESPSLALPDPGSRYVNFSLYHRGQTFPAGKFRVEVLLNGRSLRSADFAVG